MIWERTNSYERLLMLRRILAMSQMSNGGGSDSSLLGETKRSRQSKREWKTLCAEGALAIHAECP
ncbi:hypothetical protein DAA53_34155 [Bradyrhizobium sp. WBAH23]|nr:hypothetical protein [Bradyrhizobium sp. WBAH33]QCJ85581.1 hypothetical protein DAA53_34155 [Bradyrhizobium sp. WBAH23]QCK07701.1 hypothetical protein DAB18_34025 [Bradyrhizobium sp. WBAH41]